MIRHNNKSVTFSEGEIKSLKRLLSSCRAAISALVADVDFLGLENYNALIMWDDKLKGRKYDLTDYVDVDTEIVEGTTAKAYTPGYSSAYAPQTVDAWLTAYGDTKRRSTL